MPTIDLRNDTQRYLQIELPHASVCKRAGVCCCYKGGAPRTVHIAPQCWALKVPAAALLCAELQALIAKREVHVKYEKPAEGAPPPARAVQVQKTTAKNSATRAAKIAKE